MRLYGLRDALKWFDDKGIKLSPSTIQYHYQTKKLTPYQLINGITPVFIEKNLQEAINRGVGSGSKKKAR